MTEIPPIAPLKFSLLLRSVWSEYSYCTVNLPESRQMKKIEQRFNLKFILKLKKKHPQRSALNY